ncbi:MAG: BrnA antitoxin family protein [Caldilineaceae bacterium SB0670_bin_27]|uniref:BrnA antitoxin family protein n=1 Tax=Caldilineaceae bacterium SB0664_bin_27 TaxID=2605260 RepID=A0A6B0Z1J8_9CHLR|nr:BrnA antitoxin family protein [Caldilineaceae bacterium SB0664_bin_27]MYJ79042.1 BrnA antitoxin family protein [Caldilineaceae bacterium SB0670_bin_27]
MNQKTDPPKRKWETVEYTDSPELPDVEDLQIVDRMFLPRPDELVFRESETEYITVSLDKETVTFFKSKAKELGASYQTLVRSILKEYVARQSR